MIYLASYWGRVPATAARYSIARWQPREVPPLPELRFLAPERADGSPIGGLGPRTYLKEYASALCARAEAVSRWLLGLDPGQELALLCWCNPERQVKHRERGLLCHSVLVGWLIEAARPDLEVAYLDGRDRPVWTEADRAAFLRRVLPVVDRCRASARASV